MATVDESFHVIRQALTLFQETPQSPARRREAEVELLKETKADLLVGQKSLVEAVERLSGEFATMQSKRPSPRKPPLSEMVCYNSNYKGHLPSNCDSQ